MQLLEHSSVSIDHFFLPASLTTLSLSIVNSLITCTPIITLCLAFYGIRIFKSQTRWNRKHDIAEECLTLLYEIQDGFSMIRNPIGNGSEGASRPRGIGETEKMTQDLDRAYVSHERYNTIHETFTKFFLLKYRFKALYGPEYGQYFEAVFRIRNFILLFSTWLHSAPIGSLGVPEQLEQWNSTVYEVGESNKVTLEINNIILEFEKICNPILRYSKLSFSSKFLKRG